MPTGASADEDWVDVPLDPAELLAEFERRGWGDGLPVIPPTGTRIDAALVYCDHGRDEVLGSLEPGGGEITPARIAANHVMAGAPPEAFPVVLSAIAAMATPDFNLNGVQSTTHPVAPLLVVHGPIAASLGLQAGAGLFGTGFHANATIGRAVRLVLLNIGRARPGDRDRATQGQPSKFSYCIAENTAANPWGPYHAEEAGLPPESDAVTVFGGENPHNVNDHVSTTAEGILRTLVSTISTMGSNSTYYTQGQVFVVLGPEHAATVAASGFSRDDVKSYLFEHARMPLRTLKGGGMWGMQAWADDVPLDDDDALIPIGRGPDTFRILVAGGPGKHSSVLPGFGATQCVTREISTTYPTEAT